MFLLQLIQTKKLTSTCQIQFDSVHFTILLQDQSILNTLIILQFATIIEKDCKMLFKSV